MPRQAAKPRKVTTRERILEAAMLRFSKASYDATGLRDIAADVGCDVAYVHRCFGSKERLFAEVVGSALQSRRFLAEMDGDLPAALARRAFVRRVPTANEPVKSTPLTSGCSARRAPTRPSPCTTLSTPGGIPASSMMRA